MRKAGFPKRGAEGDSVEIRHDQMDFKTQKELADFARQKVEKIAPEINEDRLSPDGKYWYYPVIEQFFKREPIIDRALIKKMKAGGRLLSIGVGPADLEQLLYGGFELPKNAITLADIELSPEALASNLDKIAFDMREEWPKSLAEFDYILFPESFGIARFREEGGKRSYSNRVDRFFEDAQKVKNAVFSGNTMETSNKTWDLFKLIIEMDIPSVMKKYRTIFCAVNALKDQGELRFSGHLMSKDELAYVVMKLKEDFGKGISVVFEPYLRIKKGETSEMVSG